MEYKLVNTSQYLLIVDDSEIKVGDWIKPNAYNTIIKATKVHTTEFVGSGALNDCKKIKAHLPLNNSPILEGVDMLPSLEDEIEKLADEFVNNLNGMVPDTVSATVAFKNSYNEVKEKYKSEEDLKDIWKYIKNNRVTYKEYIQSLQQPKIPVGFKCEMEAMNIDEIREQGKGFLNTNTKKLKTTTNLQSHTQWVGEYTF